ncbi:MAG: U32 family peptidase [Ureaplasma sp.]|nr:U32 family peptidase [Ureaplasma sp.]
MNQNNKTELLAPAGDLARGYIALDYGADAIFLGGKAYSLRAHASNFEIEDIKNIIEYAHSKNKKVYIVTNVICHNSLINSAKDYLSKIVECNPDGYITADPFIIDLLHNDFNQKNIHLSTQQSVCNSKAALFWKSNYVNRVVLAREVTYNELKLLMKNINNEIEIEIFIHGAVCISYSGRCTMSNNYSLRDANIGGCAQSCRWKYVIENDEIKNKDKYFTMSAKDMVQIENINELLDLNIASFKIEGRMKSEHYIATVVNAYRKSIDRYYSLETFNNYDLKEELDNAANRETDTAWFDPNPGSSKMLYHDVQKQVTQNYIFIVNEKKDDYYLVTTKNKIRLNDQIEIISPRYQNKIQTKIISIKDLNNKNIDICPTPMTKILIKLDNDVQLDYPDIGRLI